MTVDKIDTTEAINSVRRLLKEDKEISAGLRAAIEVLIFLITALVNRLSLNSRNSSRPPSSDFGANSPEQNKESGAEGPDKKQTNKRKPGGQAGHQGSRLEPVANPDKVVPVKIDRRTLPRGEDYQDGAWGRGSGQGVRSLLLVF